MTKRNQMSGRQRSQSTGYVDRPDQGGDEDRPFAEIRKTIHDALRMLSLRRWVFFFPFCIVSCAAFILSLYYPRTYRATTSFERRNDPVMMNLPMSAGAASFKYFRNTIVRDLTSPENMREVVERLGLPHDVTRTEDGALDAASARRRDALARSLATAIHVTTTSPSEQIDIITITYTGPDPKIGTSLVDEIKRTYIRQTMAWIHQYLTSQRDYFLREAEGAREEVRRTQREDTRIRLENPHIDPRNPGALVLNLQQLEIERKELLRRKREYQEELSALQQTLAAIDPWVVSDGGPSKARQAAAAVDKTAAPADPALKSAMAVQLAVRLEDIERKIESLRATRGMTDQHPDIQALLKQQRWLAGEFDKHSPEDRHHALVKGPMSMTPPTVQTASAATSTSSLTTERARLIVQIGSQRAKLRDVEISLETNDAGIAELRRSKSQIYEKREEFAGVMDDVSRAKQRLSRLEQTLASIEPAIKAVEQDRLLQFSEGQPARGGARPVSPRAPIVILIALIAGLAVGVLLVVVAEVFDQVLRSSAQVARALGLPMLECIDEIVTSQDRRSLFIRKAVLTPVIVSSFIGLSALTGSMAYLSLERPWTYERISRVPRAVARWFAGPSTQTPSVGDDTSTVAEPGG